MWSTFFVERKIVHFVDSVLLPFYARTGTSSGKEMAGHFHENADPSELSKKAEIQDTANARKGESDEVETGVTPNDRSLPAHT
jgi:hypothetical protein